ncbi:MAG: pilus (MSHA type) biogenesis protein MshL [Woeseiaceae bacterium]|nr:pilus (MSHA type) biogenesis protein MshL [Woeseiaceae bacterium]
MALPKRLLSGIVASSLALAGCAGPATVGLSGGHLSADSEMPQVAPPPKARAVQPKPKPAVKPSPPVETYSVVVKDVPVTDLLFSLARDAGLDLDMQASDSKTVTINATERPLPEILDRIAEQARLRYSLRGRNLVIQDDQPYWHSYQVDYVNIQRDSQGEVGVATMISTSGGSVGEDMGQQQDNQGNLSKTTVRSTSTSDFWKTLELGLISIVEQYREQGEPVTPEEQDPVIANPMSGVVTVHGSQRAHKQIRSYLDKVMSNAQRQVLIEMTIVEVELSDNYQAGVDWQRVSTADGFTFQSDVLGPALSAPPFVALGYEDPNPGNSSLTATVRMLQQFGNTKVLSSPKIMALNNQTALLKVVNESVYFTIELDIREATADIPERRTFTSTIHTVPVGLIMSVTPQISESGHVSLNIRPTISSITGFAVDPAPRLSGSEFDNLIPEIQVREIESLLQVLNGHTVVLGGLMQNEQVSEKDGIPGLSRIPKVGNLFSYTRDRLVKTELVIFLKPTIVDNGFMPGGAEQLAEYVDASAESTITGDVEYR